MPKNDKNTNPTKGISYDNVMALGPVMDAKEVAELLGMDVLKVRRYAREGRLPAYRLPGARTFMFFREEVLKAAGDP
ncbi:MAG: helix-turn-helix domain-containing protein [Acidimicrobiia bacterium]|nr:helix-turn-helix domain-containing protein [bacterium]MXX65124.1 helix-turn-helix domain-containing protein [Acidimicrobiia bacterium]MXZ07491.1 helix-turn-helix domain-containing protein [Acidimicrobiia bacterium]MYD05278.1 helix-turn-helix domain-containing protein [Acidimicrobiia bacterium]MYH55140.1 helix-turn-helix domain-containing protein [Acidimicrobiia bacterium]